MLNSCFYFSASFDPETGEVSYDKRPVFYSSGGSVAVGEKGVQITGGEINFDGSINFHNNTIYIVGKTTLEDYIRQIAATVVK